MCFKKKSKILCSHFRRNVILSPSGMSLPDIWPAMWKHTLLTTFKVVSRIRCRKYAPHFASKFWPLNPLIPPWGKLLNWKTFHMKLSLRFCFFKYQALYVEAHPFGAGGPAVCVGEPCAWASLFIPQKVFIKSFMKSRLIFEFFLKYFLFWNSNRLERQIENLVH